MQGKMRKRDYQPADEVSLLNFCKHCKTLPDCTRIEKLLLYMYEFYIFN